MVHVGASTEPKIAHHKSTMENPLLYREKNEVAGTGKKLVRILVLGGKRCRRGKRMQGQLSGNEALLYNNANLKRPTFENLSQMTELFCNKKKCLVFFSLQNTLRDSCLFTFGSKNAVIVAIKVSERQIHGQTHLCSNMQLQIL